MMALIGHVTRELILERSRDQNLALNGHVTRELSLERSRDQSLALNGTGLPVANATIFAAAMVAICSLVATVALPM
jgi:hypothetical protein